MSNIVVDDEYVQSMKTYVETYGELFETYYERYIGIMKTFNETGVMEGAAADAIGKYVLAATALKGRINDLSKLYAQTLEDYLADIDVADSYLY